jgi:CBS domain-containing protein
VGGGFAPAMYLGACLGSAYGKMAAELLPNIDIAAPPAYAMVGMAAVLAGSARAPLTAILLLFELTHDYRIVLPLMAAAGLSAWLVDLFDGNQTMPTNTSNLQPMGVEVQQAEPRRRLLQDLQVEHAMGQSPLVLPGSLPVLRAGQLLVQHHQRSALITNEDHHLIGIVTLKDINRLLGKLVPGVVEDSPSQQLYLSSMAQRTIGDLFQVSLVYAYRHETLDEALKRMSARGLRQLPVLDGPRLSPELPVLQEQVLGVVDEDSADLACGMAIAQEAFRSYLEAVPVPTLPQPVKQATLGVS